MVETKIVKTDSKEEIVCKDVLSNTKLYSSINVEVTNEYVHFIYNDRKLFLENISGIQTETEKPFLEASMILSMVLIISFLIFRDTLGGSPIIIGLILAVIVLVLILIGTTLIEYKLTVFSTNNSLDTPYFSYSLAEINALKKSIETAIDNLKKNSEKKPK